MANIAYVDGQNLHMATAKSVPRWQVDLRRFRVYLEQKYGVRTAYYYLGYIQEGLAPQRLYERIQEAGFILVFRQHSEAMLSKKKGNVDSDIIFSVMKRMYKGEEFDRIILVSGDGDYKMLVDFLVEEGRMGKILFPRRKNRSSLYKELSNAYFAYLDDETIKAKIAQKKKRVP